MLLLTFAWIVASLSSSSSTCGFTTSIICQPLWLVSWKFGRRKKKIKIKIHCCSLDRSVKPRSRIDWPQPCAATNPQPVTQLKRPRHCFVCANLTFKVVKDRCMLIFVSQIPPCWHAVVWACACPAYLPAAVLSMLLGVHVHRWTCVFEIHWLLHSLSYRKLSDMLAGGASQLQPGALTFIFDEYEVTKVMDPQEFPHIKASGPVTGTSNSTSTFESSEGIHCKLSHPDFS